MLNKNLFLSFLLFGILISKAQVTISADFPKEVLMSKDIDVSIKFNKGPISNFSKYEMNLPPSFTAKEVDSKSGTFNFEENKIKIIWAITPSESEFTIKIQINTGKELGSASITQLYSYADGDKTQDLEMPTIYLSVVDSIAPVNDSTVVKTNSVTAEMDTKTEVNQLKKDSKEALELGSKEKKTAEEKIAEADKEIKDAEQIADAKKKKEAIQKAHQDKIKAENDLAMADRILVLSGSLNQNAIEIEKLNQPVDTNIKIQDSTVAQTSNSNSNSKSHVHIDVAKQNAINKGVENSKGLYKPIKSEAHHTPDEIKGQVMQMRMDSKEARDVGTKEKLKAETDLKEAYEMIRRSQFIPDDEEKKIAIEKANEKKEQAEADLEIASKILTLAKSLEENAKEIETLGYVPAKTASLVSNSNNTEKTGAKEILEPVDSTSLAETKEAKAMAKAKAKEEAKALETEKAMAKAKAKEDAKIALKEKAEAKAQALAEAKQAAKEKAEAKAEALAEARQAAKEKAIAAAKDKEETKLADKENTTKKSKSFFKKDYQFALQVGSFVNSPDLRKYKKYGKVKVVKDNEKFKVYYGQFETKDEAIEKRQELKEQGLDCFIVPYSKTQVK